MIIVFDKLFTECIHGSELHNRLRKNNLRSFFSWLIRALVEFNDLTFKEINQSRNCHFLNYKTELKIIEFFKKYAKKSEIKSFIYHSKLYQISIPSTEIRLIGALQPNYFHTKQKSYDDLFSILFIDFDHSLHKNSKKLKFPGEQELICVMTEKNCLYY